MGGVFVPSAKPKESGLDTIMKGLAIARDVYGIKSAMDDSDAKQQQRDDEQAGVLTKKEILGLGKDYHVVPEGTESALVAATRDQNGKTQPISFLPNKEKSDSALVKVTTVDPKGNQVEKFVRPVENDEYRTPTKPQEDKTPQSTADLRKEYNTNPVTKNTLDVLQGYNKVAGAAKAASPTGATDMSLIYGFMKMQDPGSTVREGEYASAENARGVPDWVVGMYNKVKDGERLTPEQRQNFFESADALRSAQLDAQSETDQRYTEIAKQFRVDPKYVLDAQFAKAKTEIAAKRGNRPPPTGDSGTAYAGPYSPLGGDREAAIAALARRNLDASGKPLPALSDDVKDQAIRSLTGKSPKVGSN